MSVPNYGDDYDYASTRLKRTVVRTKDGKAVYISDIDTGNGKVYGLMVGEEAGGTGPLPLKVEDLDLSPVPLGYSNIGRKAEFVGRKPLRFYKQGLTGESIKSSVSLPLWSKSLRDTIEGLYPSLSDCAERVVCGEVSSQAFSRNFCMKNNSGNNPSLVYREKVVGKVIVASASGSINVKLNSKFEFLSELLEGEAYVQ